MSRFDNGSKQAERDMKTDNVSESLQKNSVWDGSLGASREYKDGYRDALEKAGHEKDDDKKK